MSRSHSMPCGWGGCYDGHPTLAESSILVTAPARSPDARCTNEQTYFAGNFLIVEMPKKCHNKYIAKKCVTNVLQKIVSSQIYCRFGGKFGKCISPCGFCKENEPRNWEMFMSHPVRIEMFNVHCSCSLFNVHVLPCENRDVHVPPGENRVGHLEAFRN